MLKKINKTILVLIVALFVGLLFNFKSNLVHAFTTNPSPTSEYVTDDYDDILDDTTKGMVIGKEKEYKYHSLAKPQVVMMTVPSTNGDSIDDYSDDLLEHQQWHFGNKKYNNGVLILFARNHGKNNVRISTGYGVEPILPDLKCNDFLEHNKKLLKSHNDSKINEGLQNVFIDVTKTLDKKYIHMNKKQLKAVKREHHHEQSKKVIQDIIIGIILAIILIPPYDGNWFCGLQMALDIAMLFGGNGSSDSDDSDSGSGGLFGGGGSSI